MNDLQLVARHSLRQAGFSAATLDRVFPRDLQGVADWAIRREFSPVSKGFAPKRKPYSGRVGTLDLPLAALAADSGHCHLRFDPDSAGLIEAVVATEGMDQVTVEGTVPILRDHDPGQIVGRSVDWEMCRRGLHMLIEAAPSPAGAELWRAARDGLDGTAPPIRWSVSLEFSPPVLTEVSATHRPADGATKTLAASAAPRGDGMDDDDVWLWAVGRSGQEWRSARLRRHAGVLVRTLRELRRRHPTLLNREDTADRLVEVIATSVARWGS